MKQKVQVILITVFVAVMFTMTYRQVRHESQTDAPV